LAAPDSLEVVRPQDLFSSVVDVGEELLPQPRTSASGLTSSASTEGLPTELHALSDPQASVSLPAPGSVDAALLDNWKLDKLVAALGRSRTTWRRALMLYEWLRASNHALDDRLCTTLIRVCADHGDAVSALGVYEWMRAPKEAGGAALRPTAYTYTAAMRAALAGGMLERAMQVWGDTQAAGLVPDCRLCITYIEAATRLGLTDKALHMYLQMRDAPPNSPMSPTVHVYTAAMRAATEGGRWARALDIWEDMRRAGCQPTGHAYAAAISACAAGQDWLRAVALFDDMSGRAGIRPDVVSCTALITALASAGECDKAEAVVQWMLSTGLKPNVRTYTALLTAMGNARQWARAVEALFMMQRPECGGVQPNAYTYSALLKSLGEHGQWQLAEAVFSHLESQVKAGKVSQPPAVAAAQQAAAQQRLAAVAAAAEVAQQAADQQAAAAAALLQRQEAVGAAAPLVAAAAVAAVSGGVSPLSTVPSTPGFSSLRGSSNPSMNSLPAANTWAPVSGINTSVSGPATGSASGLSSMANSRASSSASLSSASATASDTTSTWSSPAQLNGLNLDLHVQQQQAPAAAPAAPAPPSLLGSNPSSFSLFSNQPVASPGLAPIGSAHHAGSSGSSSHAPLVNEVVCGALMLAYERAGKWSEAINVINRARALSISPNTVMYNTAISAAGKAGQLDIAEQLFSLMASRDGVTHETMVAAYGMAGLPEKAEAVFRLMSARGFRPRDYAYCGLIAAHSLAGSWEAALEVRRRMRRDGAPATVHVYNALLAACERARQYDQALELLQAMKREGVEPNMVTHSLMAIVGRQGVQSVEGQQVAAAAWSAVFAAAGTLLIRAGMF